MENTSSPDSDIRDFVNDCRSLYKISLSATKRLVCFDMNDHFEPEILSKILSEVKSVTILYEHMVQSDSEIYSKIYSHYEYTVQNYHYEVWMKRIYYQYDSLLYSVRNIIHKLLKLYIKESLLVAIRLISFYNKLVSLDVSVKVDIRYAHSASSLVLQNKKIFTMNRVLKILARNRTEECSRYLTDYLLKKFHEIAKIHTPSDNTDADEGLIGVENDVQPESDTTSILVYKTLTQFVSPPRSISSEGTDPKAIVSLHRQLQEPAMTSFVIRERQRLAIWFTAVTTEPTELLTENEIKFSKKSGNIKLRTPAKQKMTEMYEQFLWQNVGIISEHLLLWWLDRGLGRKNQLVSQKFSAWLKQYYATESVHIVVQPTIHSLIDCLCCYITSTSWDELFTQALISAGYQHARHELRDIGLGTRTGHLFSDLLYDIVFLTNSCEGSNWTLQDLENLPLVEQIPLLHRLDHSIHTARIWALSRAKYLANSWNMEQFFRVTHVDVNASLYALGQLKLAQNVRLPEGNENSHFLVCSKMRDKLLCEVHVNTEKLQDVPRDSLSILASVCKITSLAHLKISFPNSGYWQQQYENQPKMASDYVEKYLDEILKPVLLASQNLPLPVQKSVSKLVLEIFCEAWLDHIYRYRIKFSEWGAIQLLIDFGAIPIWIKEKVLVNNDIRQFLKANEILRRCEGVGRLLLRQPGESIVMNSEGRASTETGSNELENSEALMPPEMYVPNQEKWLELRLNPQKSSLAMCC